MFDASSRARLSATAAGLRCLALGSLLSLSAPLLASEVRKLEAEGLGVEIWSAEFTQQVLPVALHTLIDPNQPSQERLAAARLLDRAGAKAAPQLPALIEQLPQILPEHRWRISAVFVRSIAFDKTHATAFITMAREHSDARLRHYAVRILAATGQPEQEFTAFMLRVLNTDTDPVVRRAALRALEEHAHRESVVIERFMALLDTRDEDLRRIAARGLERAGPAAAAAIPHLLASLSSEDVSPEVRAQLWRALKSVGPQDPRVIGPRVARTSRAAADDTQPGMSQRLSARFQAEAETDRYQPLAAGRGYAHFSGRGWRGDEPALPAFPGAQGFGMWTPGGRGGQVLRVTTLADSGPGSLRAAVEAEGPRIVIFDVAGTIYLEDQLRIHNPYLTLAGQTAPGDGIAIVGQHTQIGTNDVIVRHLRFRPGDNSPSGAKAINVREGDNIIIDHVSTSWAKEETLSVVHSGRVTVQRSLITHGLVDAGHRKGERGYGSLVRGTGPDNHDYAQGSYYSFINNLWAHQRSRAPRPGNYTHREQDPVGPLFDFRNNVFYNWGGTNAGDNFDAESITRYNFIGNYYKPGKNSEAWFGFNEAAPHARAHWSANALNGEVPADQWSLVRGDTQVSGYRQSEPFKAGLVRTETAEAAYQRVLARASAWPRDVYDRRIIEEVRGGTGGMIDSMAEVGGVPELRPALAYSDTNGNGMPDWWQIRHGFAPEAPLDANADMNGSGYTNIEEYLNGTDMEIIDPQVRTWVTELGR